MDSKAIQLEYERLGYSDGWAFAMTPFSKLSTADTIFVGLNPGGSASSDDCHWDSPTGNAYFVGNWQDNGGSEPKPIQTQVRLLHTLLELDENDVFAAQFIPFRSPDFARLGKRDEATQFGKKLWEWVLPQTNAKRFICMGMEPWWHISKLLNAMTLEPVASGWGKVKIRRAISESGQLIVGLPHPSRYLLLGSTIESDRTVRESAVLTAMTR